MSLLDCGFGSDYDFACYVIESVSESTVLTLVFNRDGSVIIKESVNSPGISAGNCLGGTLYHKLRKDFYKKKTASEIAGMFRGALSDSISEDGRLERFIELAKTHRMYMGKN